MMADQNDDAAPQRRRSGGGDRDSRITALDFALRAAVARPGQPIQAQQVVQEAERFRAFLQGEADA